MSANNGYTFEVAAHWIASYFRKDKFLDIPGSVGEAIIKTERHNAWLRQRYPGMHGSLSESYSGDITFFKFVFQILVQYSILMRPFQLATNHRRFARGYGSADYA